MMCPKNCKSLGMLIIRLALGVVLIMAGLGKIMGASPDMVAMIGGVAHSLGLTFLSMDVRFWIVAISELSAGILFIVGLFVPLASVLVVIITGVAFFTIHKMSMQEGMPAFLVGTIALGLGLAGPGCRSLKALCHSKKGTCCGKSCSDNTNSTKEVVSV